jgi:hypothetical protein
MIKQLALLIVALATGLESAAAQAADGRGNLALAIVLVDELPFANARAVVVRRKDMKPQNLVLVTKQTLPGDLTRAIIALSSSRARKGDQVTADMVSPVAPDPTATRSRDYPQAVKDLGELRNARPRFIEGVGSRPVIYSHLRPAPARSGKG